LEVLLGARTFVALGPQRCVVFCIDFTIRMTLNFDPLAGPMM
jgi:hypothetical protein